MPDLTDLTTEVTTVARDAAYVIVGLGVLGFQRAQVQRVEIQRKLAADLPIDDRLTDVRTALTSGVQHLDGLVEGAVQFVESTLQPIEDQLPPAARDLAQKAHEQVRELSTHLRGLVVPAA